jgi:hypothetical protein
MCICRWHVLWNQADGMVCSGRPPRLLDTAAYRMTISTYELASARGEALLLTQFSSLLCGFAANKIESARWVGLEPSYFTTVIVWFTIEFDFNLYLCMFG